MAIRITPSLNGSMGRVRGHADQSVWQILPRWRQAGGRGGLGGGPMLVQGQLDTFYFSVMPRDQDVVEGSETRIACDVSDRRHIFFQWTQDGRPVRNTTRRFQEDSHLRILRVLREEDVGLFQCTATNATTRFSLQSNEAKLNIQCE
ncbi:hypothetical protein ACOMHN_008334 [Nucella lapillus]